MTEYDPNDYDLVKSNAGLCDGQAFDEEWPPCCMVVDDDRFNCVVDGCCYIYVKREQ